MDKTQLSLSSRLYHQTTTTVYTLSFPHMTELENFNVYKKCLHLQFVIWVVLGCMKVGDIFIILLRLGDNGVEGGILSHFQLKIRWFSNCQIPSHPLRLKLDNIPRDVWLSPGDQPSPWRGLTEDWYKSSLTPLQAVPVTPLRSDISIDGLCACVLSWL